MPITLENMINIVYSTLITNSLIMHTVYIYTYLITGTLLSLIGCLVKCLYSCIYMQMSYRGKIKNDDTRVIKNNLSSSLIATMT